MIRPQLLPAGWYPRDPHRIRELFRRWEPLPPEAEELRQDALAVISPHAGWSFSGGPAYRAIKRLDSPTTVVIVGGHLGPSASILLVPEDGFETPFGERSVDADLRRHLEAALAPAAEGAADNSVDVLVPMVAGLHPDALLLCVRAPANEQALVLGKAIAGYAETHPGVRVVGSTDLTHYGPNFAFSPAGTGERALEWARHNDRGFLDLCVLADAQGAVEHALENRSACSPGAAAAAMTFATARGAQGGALLEQSSSYEIRPDESFVGYGSVLYSPAT